MAAPYYWVEIQFEPISINPIVRYSKFKHKGYFRTEKKHLPIAIKAFSEEVIKEYANNPEIKQIKWKVLKQQRKEIDFIFDPSEISIPLEILAAHE